MASSKYSKDQDFEWAVGLNRYALHLIGLWPVPGQTRRDYFMSNLRTFFVFFFTLFGILIPCIHSLIRIRSHFILVIDNLQCTLSAVCTTLKFVIFWWKKQDITPLIDMIAYDWMKIQTYQEKIVMITRARTARIILIVGYGTVGTAFTLAVVLPVFGYSMRYITNITDPGRLLPLQTYYIYDVTKSPQYELTFFSQVFALCVILMPYTSIDNFLSLSIFHISGQLDILRNRLTRLSNVEDYIDTLKYCIMDHARLLRAIAITEDIYNIMLLILFASFGTHVVLVGVYMMRELDDGFHLSGSEVAHFICIGFTAFCHICMYCIVGEVLTAQYDRIYNAAYCNEWYTLESKDARNLILIMAKTNKPLYLTAGKVFPLSMSTFCNLLKTSAGYISVLLTTRNL